MFLKDIVTDGAYIFICDVRFTMIYKQEILKSIRFYSDLELCKTIRIIW